MKFFKTLGCMLLATAVVMNSFPLFQTRVHAQINEFYVNTSGDDTGDGSISNPWKTLNKACTIVLTQGSTIHIGSGTFWKLLLYL